MSFATARRDIEKRFTDNWATTQISYDNVHFIPPDQTGSNSEAWVNISIFEDTVTRINIGSPGYHRVVGTIVINIFTAENSGTGTARGHGDTIAAIFRDVQFNGITCREVTLNNVGRNNGWFQFNLSIPFYWDGVYS